MILSDDRSIPGLRRYRPARFSRGIILHPEIFRAWNGDQFVAIWAFECYLNLFRKEL
jgi:hypothetical protein